MKLLILIFLIPLCIPAVSKASLNIFSTLYNIKSGETYHNQSLHLYNNQHADSLLLTGNSLLTVNGESLLSNSVVNNKSEVHVYIIDGLASGHPVIKNMRFNDHSTLTMETNSISSGSLFIAQGARLNITHIDQEGVEPFLNSPQIAGNVAIENLNLAGTAIISPTGTLVGVYDEHEENNYQQLPGPRIMTHIENLTMQPGSLLSMRGYIPQMQFNLLQINTLSGSGEFILDSHLAGGLSDQMVVSGHASGHFGLTMTDSGYEPVTPKRVDVISVNHGDAQFNLLNHDGVVEAGVWQYTLQHEKNGEQSHWYLSNQQVQNISTHGDSTPENQAGSSTPLLPPTEPLAGSSTPLLPPTEPQNDTDTHPSVNQALYSNIEPILSHSAQAVVKMASTSRKIMATEMSTFRQRLDAVRSHQKNLSIWTRYLKDDSHHTRHSGSAFQTHLQGLQIGFDKRTPFHTGDWLIGSYVSDSKTTVRSGALTHGKISSQSGGIYATWLDNSGFYWDNVFKLNQLRHEIRTKMKSGQLTRGQYHQNGVSVASEAGFSLHLNRILTLTPYGKVSYFQTGQVKSVLDNGLATTIPLATSMDGEVGLMLKAPFGLDHSRLHPYLKAAVSRELVGDNTLTINGVNLALPGSGTQGKYGVGSSLQISDDLSAWAEMDYQKGRGTETPMNATLGLQVSF